MKKCPFCAEEILDDAIKCRFCGSMLQGTPQATADGIPESASAPASTDSANTSAGWAATPSSFASLPVVSAGQPVTSQAPAGEQALQYSHSGQRFLLGYSMSSYGIWDRTNPGTPVQSFPRSDDGWRQAWATYSAWEPNSAEVGLSSSAAGPTMSPPVRYSGAGMGGVPVTPGTNAMAIWSLVLSIVFLVVLGIFEIVPIILGYQARKAIKGSHGYQTGEGIALAGIVIGWIGLVGWVLIVASVVNQ